MTLFAIFLFVWLLPTLIFFAAVLITVPGSIAMRSFRSAAGRIFARDGHVLRRTADIGR